MPVKCILSDKKRTARTRGASDSKRFSKVFDTLTCLDIPFAHTIEQAVLFSLRTHAAQ